MTSISSFFRYTEIKTKITSVFAFSLCLAFFAMKGWPVRPLPTVLFFLAMFLFDLTTTAINNYVDSRTDKKTVLPFSRPRALAIIWILLFLSLGLSLWLLTMSGLFLLVLGGLSFLTGIFYPSAPLPISRLPLGEFMSGLFYGLFIPWIFFYINLDPALFMDWHYQAPYLGLTLHLPHLASLFLLSLLPFATTANIMLANNICDLDKDFLQGRRTLPGIIGVRWGLRLFALLAALPFLALGTMVLAGILRPVALIGLLAAIPVVRCVVLFFARQDKTQTFPLALRMYIITMTAGIAGVLAGRWI